MSSRDSSMYGGFTSVGAGCSTANGFMNLRSTFLTSGGANQISLQWAVQRGPSNQLVAVLVGLTNPNLPKALLCGGYFLYTDAAIMVIPGATDTVGRFAPTALTVPYQRWYVGATLTAQAGAADPTQPGLGVAASNGIASTVAPVPGVPSLARVFALSNPTATSGSLLSGYGLVTRFQY